MGKTRKERKVKKFNTCQKIIYQHNKSKSKCSNNEVWSVVNIVNSGLNVCKLKIK